MDHRSLLDAPNEELPSSRFRKAKVYVDCNSFGPRAIEAAVSLYGADRIVCGTDGTEFGCDWTRKALAEAQIGEEARASRSCTAMPLRCSPASEPSRSTRTPPPLRRLLSIASDYWTGVTRGLPFSRTKALTAFAGTVSTFFVS